MKKILLTTLLCVIAQPAFALLSPLNQSLEEISAIVHSSEIEKKIPQGQAITQIERHGNGYLLTAGEMQMRVDIQYLPSTYPGRQKFSLVFHAPTQATP